MSGLQDSLIGRKERSGENLNWSAPCSYYSLVHVGRLVSFLALGDYPTSHAELRKLMSGSADRHRRQPSDFPFDWLRDFIQPVRSATTVPLTSLLDLRSCILEYLNEIAVPNGGSRLEDFGRIFRSAAPLRNARTLVNPWWLQLLKRRNLRFCRNLHLGVVLGWNNFARDTVGKQLVRSADSVGANIAEGAGRGRFLDNRRFVRMSRGSLNET